MSASDVEQDLETGIETNLDNVEDVPMESDSEDEGIQTTKKRSKRMIIDDDDEEENDDVGDHFGIDDEDGNPAEEGVEDMGDNSSQGQDIEGLPTPKAKQSTKKRMTAKEVLEEVLQDSDLGKDEDQTMKSDAGSESGESSEEDSDDSEDGAAPKPMRFDCNLYDAEDSSDNDLDRAAGPGYDSGEDKDFDESTIDPKLLKKLKKMKGAAKKPQERKSRKCKPTKDDMLALHSESQRLMRDTHVSLPYHKPAPKSLKDFLARAQKKQEAYKNLKRGTLDIEKALIIQEKIAESSIEKLPSLQQRGRVSRRYGKDSSAGASQQSQADSGVVSSGSEAHSQTAEASEASGNPNTSDLPEVTVQPLGEDELPDLTTDNSQGLCLSQDTLKGSETGSCSQTLHDSQGSVEGRHESQTVSDGENVIVEEFDSPPLTEDSQSVQIEDVESLSVKEGDSQQSDGLTDCVADSLETDNICEEVRDNQETDSTIQDTEHNERVDNSKEVCQKESNNECESEGCHADSETIASERKHSCEDDSGIEHDFRKQLNTSSPAISKVTENKDSTISNSLSTSVDQASKDKPVNALQAARQKALEELTQKGVVPTFGKGGGDFIVLDEEAENEQKKVDELLERVMRHHPQKKQKKPQNVEISIVEKVGEEGQKEELQLKTVTYQTDGETSLDLSSVTNATGNRLQALKEKLEEGMRKRRAAAYEKRQQLYQMENEEGYGEKVEDGLPAEEEEAEMTDGSDTDEEEGREFDMEEEEVEEERRDQNNPFLDDEADEEDDDDEDEDDDVPRQRAVCAEINDMKQDDDDLFQDSDQLHLRLDQSDEEEEENEENDEDNNDDDDDDDDDDPAPARKSQTRSQRLTISDDEDSSQLQSAQDPSKSCDPALAGWNLSAGKAVKDNLDLSFEMLTPMTRLLQDTQPSSIRSTCTQPIEDSQDLYGSCESDVNPMHSSFSEDTMSQILDADGFFRVPTSQPKKPPRPLLMMEGSQDATDDNMDMLVGLCSGQFAEGSQGEAASSAGFEGLFDTSSQSQDDRGSLASLFDTSSQSHVATHRDSMSEGDSASLSEMISRRRTFSETGSVDEAVDNSKKLSVSGNSTNEPLFGGFLQSQKDKVVNDDDENMNEVLGLCSGTFPSSNVDPEDKKQAGGKKKRGVKRRLIVHDDSSDDEEDAAGTGPFLVLSDDDATKDSDKNELSGSDDENEEDRNSDGEQEPSFRGVGKKGKILQQFVEAEAELSGSEEESDENLDLDEEEDYLEMEDGDKDVLNEDQLRDQVGRVHMKQILDDDDRQLMRYKEMYLPDGDMHSEGGGRQRRFHWKNFDDDESQPDLFATGSDEEKDMGEDPDEKQWRMERHEREKFLESQQEEAEGDGEKDNSQFMKFGQFFMKRQVSEPASVPPPPMLSRPKPVRSQSLVDKTSPGKFLKPKVPKRGSFLSRSKENLARIAEITKSSGLNVNGTRGSRSFVFSVNSADKGEDENKEQLLTKAAAKGGANAAAKKGAAHKPPAKKKCVEASPKSKSRKSIFKLLDK